MKLKEYIKSNGYNYRSFGKAIGISWRNIEMWSRGERLPRWEDAEKIFLFTENQVTGTDLYAQQILRKKADLQRNEV
tara:strand:+ start:251 stop:481 length:231 start_codon:yes stop_codon:yes gene_type:complete